MTPYERVKLSRERTAATFPLPSVTDCIRYAICELAEMEDAWLRIERADDKRNNVRQSSPYDELGQAVYMLLSAAVQLGVAPKLLATYRDHDTYIDAYAYALYTLAALLTMMQRSQVDAERLQMVFDAAYSGIYATGAINGVDSVFDSLIDDTCAAFERKHAPAVQP